MQTVNKHHWFVSIDSKVAYQVLPFGLAHKVFTKCVRVALSNVVHGQSKGRGFGPECNGTQLAKSTAVCLSTTITVLTL